VPLDGSELADEILPFAMELARAFGSRLFLFTAVPGGPDGRARETQAGEYLSKRGLWLKGAGVKCETFVRVGAAAEEALTVVTECGLDAVAMTTHGRSGIARAVYGSVAEKILSHAEVPLLVVRNRRLREGGAAPNHESRAVEV
jgi:nucleotide-binding universal stress UspA family protein